jgi:hypothetical protein
LFKYKPYKIRRPYLFELPCDYDGLKFLKTFSEYWQKRLAGTRQTEGRNLEVSKIHIKEIFGPCEMASSH